MEDSRVFHLGGRATVSDTSDHQNTQAHKGQSSRLSGRVEGIVSEGHRLMRQRVLQAQI
ncbi:hypothetical protein D3C87_887070 [compost metagenome]